MTNRYPISITPEVRAQLDAGAVVAMGVSGGKDSSALAIRLTEYLDEIGHTGPRVLIHSHLGRVEWKESLPVCERLAARLGLELIVVERAAGDLMDRWLKRWSNNLQRYMELSCVKMILPWSTPSMRFCTSELKTDVICAELVKRFPGQVILSATGVRSAESASRAKMAVASLQPKLARRGSIGMNWNAIKEFGTDEVFEFLAERNEPLHEGYTRFNSSRISCVFCIMATLADLTAASSCEDNVAIYREMVQLEIDSTFAFQGARWLGDVAPHLLSGETLERLAAAKAAARVREAEEARIPKHLLYTAGWPAVMPTWEEAELLAEVRQRVAAALQINIHYQTAAAIMARYADLMQQKSQKEGARRRRPAKPVHIPIVPEFQAGVIPCFEAA